VALGKQAAGVVLKHYAMDPLALDSKTQQPLPRDGGWSISKARPASCPQTSDPCVEVFYQVPAESVRCSWVVLLNADGADGTFLDENDDAERYFIRTVMPNEAEPFINTRKKPTFPAIGTAAHISGTVVISVLVGKSGEVQKATVVSGPPMFRAAAADAAQQWNFKPMMVGARAVPYHIGLWFAFRITGPLSGAVETTP
jgi:TonB family protein